MAVEIIAWVGGILAMIAAVWFGGRSSGKDSEKAKRSEVLAKEAEVKQKIHDMVTEAKRKADAENIDSVRARVKSGSVRKRPEA